MGLKVIFIDFIFIILLHHGYSQLDCGLNNQCTERICTGLTRKITCKSGGVLSITGAFFGRTSTIDCKNPSGTITDCVPNATLAESQLDNAKRLCDNETECTLKASFNFQDECKVDVWGDPCPSKSKYIVVNFTCISTGALNFWTEWSNWGACSKSCDAGVRTRTRNCVDPPKKSCTKSTCKGRSYPDVETATQSCNLGVCPASSSKSPPSTSIETSSSTSRIPPSTSSTSYSTLTSTSTASSTLLPASSSFSPTPVIPTTSSYSPSASNSAPSETGIFSATIVMSSIPASTLSISSISSPRQSATASPPSPTSLIAASASFMASSTSKTSLPSASSGMSSASTSSITLETSAVSSLTISTTIITSPLETLAPSSVLSMSTSRTLLMSLLTTITSSSAQSVENTLIFPRSSESTSSSISSTSTATLSPPLSLTSVITGSESTTSFQSVLVSSNSKVGTRSTSMEPSSPILKGSSMETKTTAHSSFIIKSNSKALTSYISMEMYTTVITRSSMDATSTMHSASSTTYSSTDTRIPSATLLSLKPSISYLPSISSDLTNQTSAYFSSSSSLPIISSQVEEKVSTSIKIAPTTRRESVSTSATIKTRLFTPSIEVSMVLSSSNSPQRSISTSKIKSMSLISISDSMVVTSSTTEPIATLLLSSTEVQTSPTIEVTLSTSRSTPALKSSSYQIGSSASTILSVTEVLPPLSTSLSVTRSSTSATKSSTSASKSSTSASKSLTSIEATPTKSSTSSSSTKSETQSSTTPTKSIEPSPSTSTVMSSSVAVLPPTKEPTEKPKTTTQSNTTSKPTDSPITNATTEGLNTNATTKKPTDTPLTITSLPTTKEPTIATTERLYTTDAPDKPDFYGNVTFTMLWKDFCKYSPEFREGLAKVLSKNVEKSTGADQVIVMNLGNCKSSPDEAAVVKFYISYKSSKEPNKDLTNAAVVELLKLLQGGDTAEIGKHFGNGTFTHVVFVVHDDHDEDDWPIWLIILIIVASLIFLLWLCCCCWIFCGKKEKEPVKRKYTFQHIDPLGIPHVKISDENGNAKPTYTSTMTVTVRPKSPAATHFDNPAYEMNEYPPTPSFGFRPVNVKLVNLKSGDDSDIEKKPDSGSDSSSDDEKSPPSPETTKVYLDGKLVQEIPVLEKATEL
ncbi:serine-rich adhesin for platelets-like isoform X4 [Hydractinia symbiolongicarpus]|uniref:serine-rich adhesin for platelets-like isoform X4 n=1 Tax=Hydractinia symbiolongicarpus TaxID=13093 RepID=UPI002550BD85|nr:serine-rich adhesin for platelets-like isoform X4 [Hydractinia symbiolongicarpus]